jgi:type II secretory pathway pseudopilin PulG
MLKTGSKNSGMTLTEILVTISILIVIMGAVSLFQFNVLNYNRSAAVSLTNAYEAQNILKVAAKELRSMEQSSTGTYSILSAATGTLTFYADVDSDGSKEQIHYYLSTTTLYRGILKPSGSPIAYTGSESIKILATGIRNSSTTPVFEYFDATYAGTSTPMTYPLNLTNIRSIKINLTIDTDPSKSPILRSFSTQASLRNLKDNL